ncbi:MAG TPA: CocE/NonD family hydrolase [Candidatus Dormibacteraeota bacterium]|nr:CocE/NonD family hydrolase [Candidatus Dormibacteraeota bacterium]
MRIDWDVPIPMDDGVVLRGDVFRPEGEGRYPVILSYGPYGKWLRFQDGYVTAWERLSSLHPEVTAESSNRYMSWEVVDPERWVPDGYVCLRIDSRGAGRSPGFIDPRSPRETKDLYDCIEWAAAQPWSTGKVGMCGISYYAVNQWQVAALQPPHLAACCIWEGSFEPYREQARHGGMLCTFRTNWFDMQVKSVQHGLGTRGARSGMTGEWVAGPETLTAEELGGRRVHLGNTLRDQALDGAYWQERSPDLSRVTVPLLSAGNWGGAGLHLRGNVEGFVQAASSQKWLEMHGLEHWTSFYTDYGLALQKRFLGHFLKGEKTGWERQPRVLLQVRHVDRFEERGEDEWPLARTRWTRLHLHPAGMALDERIPSSLGAVSFSALGDGLTFLTQPFEREAEITGPLAAKLWVSSTTSDADLFLVLRLFAPDFREVVFQGALDPHTPVAQGWLRASHRKLDPARSQPWRPYHTHDERQSLEPGIPTELDVEIWPTCIVVPAGYRLGLSVRGRDYVYPGGSGGRISNMRNEFTGCGPFLHDDPLDRPIETFGGTTTVHAGPGMESHLLLPIVP